MNKYEVTLTLVIGLYTSFVIHSTSLNSEVIAFPSCWPIPRIKFSTKKVGAIIE